MAELRVTSTGTIKLFESDDTSSVTIASPASLGGDRTITLPDANVDLTEVNTMPIANLDIDGGRSALLVKAPRSTAVVLIDKSSSNIRIQIPTD